MNILLLASNKIGLEAIKHLSNVNEKILGLGVVKNNEYTKKIIKNSKLGSKKIFFFKKKINSSFIKKIKKLNLDHILVVGWPYILKKNFYSIPKNGAINFHLSYLPFNMGKNPNVWPFIDNTPAGVSIHYIDSGIDSGDIIFQKRVSIEPIDTAKSLYEKLNLSLIKLFKKKWNKIKKGKFKIIKNKSKKGTFHLKKQFEKLGKINLNQKIYPIELINILRAKSFSPFPSAYMIYKKKKIFINISLKYKKNNE